MRQRNNVLDLHLGAADLLRCLAIAAAVAGGNSHPTP